MSDSKNNTLKNESKNSGQQYSDDTGELRHGKAQGEPSFPESKEESLDEVTSGLKEDKTENQVVGDSVPNEITDKKKRWGNSI